MNNIPICLVCGAKCGTVYTCSESSSNEIIGCENCVDTVDAHDPEGSDRCPICGSKPDHFYRGFHFFNGKIIGDEIVGCSDCVAIEDASKVCECFPDCTF